MGSVRRLVVAVAALVAVTIFGTLGYLLLGFSLLEALYQTVTTVSTVGFREVRPLGATGEAFTIALIILGVGTVLYNLGVALEILTEGQLRQHLERRRMDARIAALRGHVIICGYGRVGRAATDFLTSAGHEVVVVDCDVTRLTELPAGVAHLVGDVTEDRVLREAGSSTPARSWSRSTTTPTPSMPPCRRARCARTW